MSLIKNGKKIAGLYKATEVEHSTEERAGIIEIAKQGEVLEGSNDSKVVTPAKLKQNYYNKTEADVLLDNKQNITDNSLVTLSKTVPGAINELDAKIKEIELFKAPNVLIVGEPAINNGQVIGFSKTNYLVLPFEFDVKDRAFELTYCFRTGTDVTTAQNLFGSKFSIASYIQNGKFMVRVSSNGTSWDILDVETSLPIQSNTTYYIKLIFNKLNYEVKASTDGVEYSQVGYVVDTRPPFAGDIYIGIGNNQNNPFLGMINLHKWELKYNNFVFWEGMDDAGLATRADISLSNLDEEGEARFEAKQDVIEDLTEIRSNSQAGKSANDTIATYGNIVTHNTSEFQVAGDYATNTALTEGLATKQDTIEDLTDIRSNASAGATAKSTVDTHVANSTIHVTAQDKVAWSNKQNKLVAGANITIDDKTNTISASGGLAEINWGGISGTLSDQTDLQTALNGKQATIDDLGTIRNNATSGKSASDTIATYGNIVTHNANEFQVAGDYATNDRVNEVEEAIPTDNTQLNNGAGYITAAYHDSTKQNVISDLADIRSGAALGATALQSFTETDPTVPAHVKSITSQNISDWNAKQGAISDLSTIRANATAGKGAADTIATYGNIVTHNANEFQAAGDYATNTALTQGLAGKQNTISDLATIRSNAATGAGLATQVSTNTSNIAQEVSDRQDADAGLQEQIDAIVAGSDVKDIVGTKAELDAYDKSKLGDNDIIKVLEDSTQNNASTYYRYKSATQAFEYIGKEGPFYTKSETDGLLNGKQATISDLGTIRENASAGKAASTTIAGYGNIVTHNANEFQPAGSYVPTTRKVNNKALSADITLTASDVGATTMAAVEGKGYAVAADLAKVATTGKYTDLTGLPTIPSAVTEDVVAGWGFTKNTGTYSKPTGGIPKTDLASAVQTSLGLADTALQGITSSDVTSALGFTPYNATNPEGYTSNKGTVTKVNNVSPDTNGNVTLSIPTVNNATLTIQKNGTNVATFTANSSTNATANIAVPTKVSELTNDSGFTTNTGTVTGITMNGVSKGTSGVVDLGTVLTAHQSLDNCAQKQGLIGATTDWDTCTTYGCYKVQTGVSNLSATYHAPEGEYGYGLLVVEKSNIAEESRTLQIYYPHGSAKSRIWTRMLNGTTWTAWSSVADTKVQSVVSTGNVNYPLLLNNGTAATTNNALINTNLYANPSTGVVGATKVEVAKKVNMQYNSTTESLEIVFA